jgi:hypothetical protein
MGEGEQRNPNLSSSGEPQARPGDPVLTGLVCDYWVARSSRAMTVGRYQGNNQAGTYLPSRLFTLSAFFKAESAFDTDCSAERFPFTPI